MDSPDTRISDVIRSKPVVDNAVGGQAVMEGVMMRGKKGYAVACRTTSNTIAIQKKELAKLPTGVLKWPVIRGIRAFVDSLVMGMKIMTDSAELAGLTDFEDDEENQSKFDK